MNQKQLDDILTSHKLYLDTNAVDGKCAIFTGSVLRNVDLRGADLRYAIFTGADLRGADIDHSSLQL